MYRITCESCGQVGFHPSRIGAESQAERHVDDTGHPCRVEVLEDAVPGR